ncbi:MAG: CDP-glycerol glycerophosphotransferase family protein [Clostridiales Family XIII bacterium]|nr:CDP-glycerol glycerophosphotransferase family protein [Clostridiales Family XIII bacterium]
MIDKFKTWARGIAKRNVRFRKLMRFGLYVTRGALYAVMSVFIRRDERRVMFVSFNGRAYSDTPKAVYEYMISRPEFSGYKFVWVFKEPGKHAGLLANPGTEIVAYKTNAHRRELIRSKYWVVNFRVFKHAWPRRGQVYLQCWHGTPLKRLGFDILESDNAMNSRPEILSKYITDAKKITWLLSPSAYATEKFASAWNLAEYGKLDRILEVGYPRNDRLAVAAASGGVGADEAARIRASIGLPLSGGKKVILYAPTWRDNQFDPRYGYTYDLKIDFDRLRDELGDGYEILFRVHYLVMKSFDFAKYDGFIYDCSDYDDINDLYLISDLLLTDYSSVFFDYAVLEKPMLFYMYDLDEYAGKTRGFYFDAEELPGRILRDESELAPAIRGAFEEPGGPFAPDEKYLAFKKKYASLDDGAATARLVEKVWNEG